VTWKEELLKWKQDGSELLAKAEGQLVAKTREREALDAEIEQLRVVISEMRSTLPPSAERVGNPMPTAAVLQGMASPMPRPGSTLVKVPPSAPIADVVRAILAAADGPKAAKDIIGLVASVRDVQATDIHRAIYRLKEAGEIEVFGERPNSHYALKRREQQTSLAG